MLPTVEVRVQIVWALRNLMQTDEETFQSTLIQSGLIQILTNDIAVNPQI